MAESVGCVSRALGSLPERRSRQPVANLRRSLFRLLKWIEAHDTSGTLTVSSEPGRGCRVLIAKGRVCLATGAAKTSPVAALDPIQGLVGAALRTGAFSSTVLASGGAATAQVRGCMLDVTAQALAESLDGAVDEDLSWTFRAARDDYAPELSLSPAEMFVATLRLAFRDPAAMDMDGASTTRLLILRRGEDPAESPYPIVAHGFAETALTDLSLASRRVAELFAEPAPIRAGTVVRAVSAKDGHRIWRYVDGPRYLGAMEGIDHVVSDGAFLRLLRFVGGSGERQETEVEPKS